LQKRLSVWREEVNAQMPQKNERHPKEPYSSGGRGQ
jgi:hypothetical protein